MLLHFFMIVKTSIVDKLLITILLDNPFINLSFILALKLFFRFLFFCLSLNTVGPAFTLKGLVVSRKHKKPAN